MFFFYSTLVINQIKTRNLLLFFLGLVHGANPGTLRLQTGQCLTIPYLKWALNRVFKHQFLLLSAEFLHNFNLLLIQYLRVYFVCRKINVINVTY